VDDSVAESPFIQQFELQANVVRKGLFAASYHDGRYEQVQVVDEPGLDRLRREVGAAHG